MAKKKVQVNNQNISFLAEKMGIKKENLEYGLKKNKEQLEKSILNAAKFMGLK